MGWRGGEAGPSSGPSGASRSSSSLWPGSRAAGRNPMVYAAGLALTLQVLVFFSVYVMTPFDPAWHISTSWARPHSAAVANDGVVGMRMARPRGFKLSAGRSTRCQERAAMASVITLVTAMNQFTEIAGLT